MQNQRPTISVAACRHTQTCKDASWVGLYGTQTSNRICGTTQRLIAAQHNAQCSEGQGPANGGDSWFRCHGCMPLSTGAALANTFIITCQRNCMLHGQHITCAPGQKQNLASHKTAHRPKWPRTFDAMQTRPTTTHIPKGHNKPFWGQTLGHTDLSKGNGQCSGSSLKLTQMPQY